MMELWQYEGEPTQEEIIQRLEFWQHWDRRGVKGNHLRIWRPCPNCDGDNTEWVRQRWHVCYDCLITWDGYESLYDVKAYEADDRIEQEILEEVYNE